MSLSREPTELSKTSTASEEKKPIEIDPTNIATEKQREIVRAFITQQLEKFNQAQQQNVPIEHVPTSIEMNNEEKKAAKEQETILRYEEQLLADLGKVVYGVKDSNNLRANTLTVKLKNDEEVSFVFTHTIMFAQVNNASLEQTCVVLSQHKKGQGGNGSLLPVLGTISENGVYQKRENDFVVKRMQMKGAGARLKKHKAKILKVAMREAKKGSSLEHLQTNMPVLKKNEIFLFMNRAFANSQNKVYDLEYILEQGNLDVADALGLAEAILQAIKTQLADKQIVHNDIKPGNLMVMKQGEQWKVQVVDLGSARTQNKKKVVKQTTSEFVSSEVELAKGTSLLQLTAADVYSAGAVFDEIVAKVKAEQQSAPELVLLKNLAKQMKAKDKDRPSLDECINPIQKIRAKLSATVSASPQASAAQSSVTTWTQARLTASQKMREAATKRVEAKLAEVQSRARVIAQPNPIFPTSKPTSSKPEAKWQAATPRPGRK